MKHLHNYAVEWLASQSNTKIVHTIILTDSINILSTNEV